MASFIMLISCTHQDKGNYLFYFQQYVNCRDAGEEFNIPLHWYQCPVLHSWVPVVEGNDTALTRIGIFSLGSYSWSF